MASRDASPRPRENFFARTLDRAISLVSPTAGLNRAIARHGLREFSASAYDAANPGHRRGESGGMFKNAAAESWQVQKDRLELMWEARAAERNFCFIGGVLDRVSMYACQKIAYQPDTGDAVLNQQYADYFHDWCARADLSGRLRFRELVELSLRGMLRDGDAGLLMVNQGEELRLQAIEADRIGSPIDAQQTETYIGGFTINDLGQIESIKVYERTRTAQYINPQEVSPDHFIHLFRPTRTDQYRGVTPLAPCLPHARDIYEWFASEKQAGKTASLFSAFITKKDPYAHQNPSGPQWDDKRPGMEGTKTMDARAGIIMQTLDGENVVFPNIPSRPSGAFLSFVQVLIREMATGLNLPYGFVYDLAQLGGVTARIELEYAQRVLSRYQELLTDRVLDRVKNDVIARAIAYGKLPPCERWKAGRWQFGARLTGDVGYQTTADIQKIKMGGKAMDDWIGESGEDALAVARKNAHYIQGVRAISAETGVPAEMIAADYMPQATAMLAAMNTPPAPPPAPPPGLIGTLGEKGVKPLLEILTGVSEGKMERESAVETLIVTYGIDRSQAELLVPDEALPQPKPAPALREAA